MYLFTQTKRPQADAPLAGFGFLRLCVVRRGKQTATQQSSATSEGTPHEKKKEGAAKRLGSMSKREPLISLFGERETSCVTFLPDMKEGWG